MSMLYEKCSAHGCLERPKVRKAPSLLVAANCPDGMPPAFGFTDIYVPLEGGRKKVRVS